MSDIPLHKVQTHIDCVLDLIEQRKGMTCAVEIGERLRIIRDMISCNCRGQALECVSCIKQKKGEI